MTLADLAAEADELARLRVRIGSQDQHAPVEDLSELRHRLGKLAGMLRKLAQADEPAAKPERRKFEAGIRAVGGRLVRAEVRNRKRAC